MTETFGALVPGVSPIVVRLLLQGIGITVLTTVLSALLAGIVAFGVGLARLSPIRVVRVVAAAYVEFFRGTSALVQLYWGFFILPYIGIPLSPMLVGIGVLGCNAGAYGSEIVRGAILAVPRGQWEAASALSLSPPLRMFKVILPQALPTMMPSFGNLAIDVMKATSLLSLITVTDLTRVVSRLAVIGSWSFSLGYSVILVGYFCLSLPLIFATRLVERRSRQHMPEVTRP
ncbi:MAG TPA: ectoine/hydroxyectoine ABC transporter permease subunit EhuC [bacterium]|nr:ectoine/hydroxyectoine ABC transporter permease subunit EhuC [bacterium]